MIGVRAIGWCGIISFLAQFRGNAETFLAYRTQPMDGGGREKSERGKFFLCFLRSNSFCMGREILPTLIG